MHYSQPNARLNLHFCQAEREKRFELTGSIKHDQACYHRHHICVTMAFGGPELLCRAKKKKKSESIQMTVISRAKKIKLPK